MTINDLQDLVRLLTEHPEWQVELRRLILTDELLELPSLARQLVEAQQRTEERVAQLIEAQRRTEEALGRTQEQVAQLIEAQRRTEEALGRTQEQVAFLTEAQQRTQEQVASLSEVQQENQERLNQLTEAVKQLSEEVRRLVEWQRGEAGRREGERYERRLIKRAPVLFKGGKGGATDSPLVQEQLIKWLQPLFAEDRILPLEEDPSLADVIWWKGTKVLIGEVSHNIDRHDVLRILQRAITLRQVGVDATPFVAGNGWATPEAEVLAQDLGVEWLIDSKPSAGLIAFRQLPDPATTTEPPPAG